MLNEFMGMIGGGIAFLGGALIVWGAVRFGLAVRDGATGGGAEIATSVSMIVGGAVIIAAAAYFGTLDTSWAG